MGCGIRVGRAKLRANADNTVQIKKELTPKLTVLDLFSGIGGFSLGLERTGGFRTVAFCEIDPYCRQVLKRHWPEVPCHADIRALSLSRGSADVICGGFPCQDISTAGKGAGIAGERSGLWVEMCRIIGEVRPRYAIVENVAALLGRGLGRVLGDLAAIGYDAEWHCIPASAVGAPHRRDRIWIVAYLQSAGQPSGPLGSWEIELGRGYSRNRGDARGQWLVEPDVGRVAHGVPRRVDRLRALGNAVVPQIPELIGRAILRAAA
jgi:DNA (cytosine-5)-methyltransferase 1